MAAKYKCRNCDQPLFLRRATEGKAWDRDWFTHTEVVDPGVTTAWEDEGRFCEGEPHRRLGQPKEICMFIKESDGEECMTKVRPENIESGDYACGVHLPKVIADRERQEAHQKREEERRERYEMAEWECSFYQAAFDKLHEIRPALFPADDRPVAAYGRFDREIRIDLVELERWIRELTTDG